jgi:hypothetical protein
MITSTTFEQLVLRHRKGFLVACAMASTFCWLQSMSWLHLPPSEIQQPTFDFGGLHIPSRLTASAWGFRASAGLLPALFTINAKSLGESALYNDLASAPKAAFLPRACAEQAGLFSRPVSVELDKATVGAR